MKGCRLRQNRFLPNNVRQRSGVDPGLLEIKPLIFLRGTLAQPALAFLSAGIFPKRQHQFIKNSGDITRQGNRICVMCQIIQIAIDVQNRMRLRITDA